MADHLPQSVIEDRNDEEIEEEEDPEEDPEEEREDEPFEEEPIEEEPIEEEMMEEARVERVEAAEEKDEEEVMEEEEEEVMGGEEEGEEEAEEISESIKERRKQRELEVFVEGLPRDATEKDVEMAFKEVGEVVEVRLVKNSYSAFGFIRFATVDQASKAVTELKRAVVKGKSCGLMGNKDSVTLHIARICTSWTKDDLVEKLKPFDLENLEYIHLIDDPHNQGKNRGFAFLDFSTHMDAVAACTKLRRKGVFFGTDVRADITISKTVEPDEEEMTQVKSVFLDGICVNWEERQLRKYLKEFGEIEDVKLACNMPTAKRKDFCFVSFTTREAAMDCINKVNIDGIGEGADKVLVKATLKKPKQKHRPWTSGVRGGYIGKGLSTRAKRSYRFARSFRGRGSSDGFRSPGRFSYRIRGAAFKEPKSTKSRRSGPQFMAEYSRERHDSARAISSSRSREPYYESSSSNRDNFYSTTYSQLRRPYSDDYDYDYDHSFEYREPYEYDDLAQYDRSYSAVDRDMRVSNSQPRRGRSRAVLEMDAYQEHYRFSPDERTSYESGVYASQYYPRSDPRTFND